MAVKIKKKRVAFVVNSLYGGGAEKILQTVLRNIDRQKYDITLINHRQEEVNELYPKGIKYKSILKSKSKAGGVWVKIYNKINLLIYENFSPQVFRRIYLNCRFDVEIAFIEGYATRIVSAGRSTKKIVWVHTDLIANHWTQVAFRSKEEEAECYLAFDEVVSVSKGAKQSFDKLFRSRQSVVIYNPIDSDEIIKKSLAQIELPPKTKMRFVTAGRLVEQKGYDRLLEVVKELVNEGYDFELWIMGDGPQGDILMSYINENNLGGYVKLWGFIPNPYPLIASGDFFVCSSHSEGYSTVVTEALILGVPVVTTLCSGMRELLGENNEWGIIVENEDRALLNAMREILTNQELTHQYRAKASQRGNDFLLENQMNEIYSVIER